VLKQVNNTRSNTLHPGQTIMVPGGGKAGAVASADAAPRSSGKSTSKSASAEQEKTRKIAQSRANYKVQSGDTLWDISRRFGVSVRTLQVANGLSSKSRIKVGQKLYIPDATGQETRVAKAEAEQVQAQLVRYKVRRGDNLYRISQRFGVTVDSIRKWNKMGRGNTIYAGQYLNIYVQ
jgi:membrane-bound lytic murein transglycosylase D